MYILLYNIVFEKKYLTKNRIKKIKELNDILSRTLF